MILQGERHSLGLGLTEESSEGTAHFNVRKERDRELEKLLGNGVLRSFDSLLGRKEGEA